MQKGLSTIWLLVVIVVVSGVFIFVLNTTQTSITVIHNDTNKLYKIEAAFDAYYTQYKRLPGVQNNKFMMPAAYDILLSREFLTKDDFVVNLEGENKYIQLAGCSRNSRASGLNNNIHKFDSICAFITTKEPSVNNNEPKDSNIAETSTFACYVDSQLDDSDYTTGRGRAIVGHEADFDDCEDADAVKGYTYLVY